MEKNLARKADLVIRVDASWMKLLGLMLREGISARTAEAIRDMETLRLQAGLPGLEEVTGYHVRLH